MYIDNLKYEGHKFDLTKILEMIRLKFHGRSCMNEKILVIEDKLIHYVYVHIPSLRGSN